MESIACPGCQKVIRVPVEVLGQRAQCPFCKCHFRAPTRTPEGLTEPVLVRRNPFANRRVAPGMLLLCVGLVGMLISSMQAGRAYLEPRAFEDQTRDTFNQMADKLNMPDLRDRVEGTVKWRPRIQALSALLNVLTVLGAFSMLRAKWHGLAVLGSVVTMVNVGSCCCIVNVLIGGWSFMTLINPAVRAEFSAAQTGTPPAG